MTATRIRSDIDLLPPVIEMTIEGSRAFFDEKAPTLLGIGGEEFHLRLIAGDDDEIIDDPEHSDRMYLALFLPRGR